MKIKGMDKNMQCRGFQFEVGKEYKIDTKGKPLKLCTDTVFHYCNALSQVNNFYNVREESNRYFEIEVLGEEVCDGEKCGSNRIRIVREIVGEELATLKGLVNGNTGLFNSGDRNSGNRNSGDYNSGYYNSGNRNSGDCNSGFGNSCDFSNGVFCNEEDKNIRIFNQPSGMSLTEFYRSQYYEALTSVAFKLTEWIKFSEEEMACDERKAKIGGYLKTYSYKEAWQNWWNELTDENKEIIQQIPNFDAEIFKDITGIEVK